MNNNIDYLKEVNERIEYANVLSNIPEENREAVIKLLDKKRIIKEKNSIFAFMQLSIIDKKINKLKK